MAAGDTTAPALLAADALAFAAGGFVDVADVFACAEGFRAGVFRAGAFRAGAFVSLAFRVAGGVGDGGVGVAAVPWTFAWEPDPVDSVDVSSAIACLLWCAGHCPPRHSRRHTEPC
jgi:hypothetical protein